MPNRGSRFDSPALLLSTTFHPCFPPLALSPGTPSAHLGLWSFRCAGPPTMASVHSSAASQPCCLPLTAATQPEQPTDPGPDCCPSLEYVQPPRRCTLPIVASC